MTKASRVLGVQEDLSPRSNPGFRPPTWLPLGPGSPHESRPRLVRICPRRAISALYDRPIRDITIPLLKIDMTTGKLEAILAMRSAGSEYAAVCKNGTVRGLVTEGDLVEEFFISQQTVGR